MEGPVGRQEAFLELKRLLQRMPLSQEEQRKVAGCIQKLDAAQLAALGLGPPPRPLLTRGMEKLGDAARLAAVQRTISSLQYNHSSGYHYNVSKTRPFSRIMDTARDVLRAALPIKCLEAAFLGAYLTAAWTGLDRIPLAFKSRVGGGVYRHIVLAVRHTSTNAWGALGISRRPQLGGMELGSASSLASLVCAYKAGYSTWGHTVLRVYVGLPLEHDMHYPGPVFWRYLNLNMEKHSWEWVSVKLDRFVTNMNRAAIKARALGAPPPMDSAANSTLNTPRASTVNADVSSTHTSAMHSPVARAVTAAAQPQASPNSSTTSRRPPLPGVRPQARTSGGSSAPAVMQHPRAARSVSPSRRREALSSTSPSPSTLLSPSSRTPLLQRTLDPRGTSTAASRSIKLNDLRTSLNSLTASRTDDGSSPGAAAAATSPLTPASAAPDVRPLALHILGESNEQARQWQRRVSDPGSLVDAASESPLDPDSSNRIQIQIQKEASLPVFPTLRASVASPLIVLSDSSDDEGGVDADSDDSDGTVAEGDDVLAGADMRDCHAV